MDRDEILRVLRAFEESGLEYVLIGARMSDVPVQKFRSIEEMNAAPPRSSTPADFERFLRHCARYWKIAPKVYPRGVLKFKSIEEAQHPAR